MSLRACDLATTTTCSHHHCQLPTVTPSYLYLPIDETFVSMRLKYSLISRRTLRIGMCGWSEASESWPAVHHWVIKAGTGLLKAVCRVYVWIFYGWRKCVACSHVPPWSYRKTLAPARAGACWWLGHVSRQIFLRCPTQQQLSQTRRVRARQLNLSSNFPSRMPWLRDLDQSEYEGLCFMMGKKRGKEVKLRKNIKP